GSTVKVWSPQFGRDENNAQEFTGITKIIGMGGAGDDLFDLSRVDDNNIDVEIHGGDGNDTIKGPKHAKSVKLFGDAGNDNITGGDGPDLIDGGVGDDTIAGGAGNDTITGGEGADQIDGGTGDDVIDGGTGDDQISGGGGSDTYLGASAG